MGFARGCSPMPLTVLPFVALLFAPDALQAPPDPMGIVNGDPVETCGWPTTVYTGGCTATLVHPRAISTAQHCGMPSAIQFGIQAGDGPSVAVTSCVGDGSQDAMLCELAEEVTEVPVTPVLFGCEADMYLQPGQPVVMAGFGQTAFGVGGGTKLWANQTISAVEPGRVIVGEAGDGTSPCPGDSGGPVFLQVEDGSWRVFGTVLGGTTQTPCNSAADFQRIDAVVGNFEAQTGLDITPCFDGATGDWDPGPDCGSFFAGDHTGDGSWDNWCEGIPESGYSSACGEPFASNPTESTTGATSDTDGDTDPTDGGGETGAESTTGGASGGNSGTGSDTGAPATSASADGSGGAGSGSSSGGLPDADGGDGGGGCSVPSQAPPVSWLLLLLVAGLRRRS